MTSVTRGIVAVAGLTTLLTLPTHFENITQKAGIDFKLTSGTPSKRYILESMGGGVGFIDYDNDGWADIYLVNGSTIEDERRESNKATHRLFHNNRNGTFTDVTEKAGVGGNRHWGMGVCVGDVNNDGFDDLYITSYGPNVLYLNNGNGTFRDFSQESGTNFSSWSSSCAFADYDGDGDLDLYVSNYLEFDISNLPADSPICRFRGFKVQCGPRGLTPAAGRLYENLGDGRFIDVSEKSGIGKAPKYYSLGVVWGDYDNDGDLDLFVANDSTPNFLFRNNGDQDGPPTLLRNDGGNRNHWLMVRCVGHDSNRSAIGTRLLLRSGKLEQMREIKAGSGYASQNDTRVHFGLGPGDQIDELEIRWPSGKIQNRQNLKTDQILTVHQGSNDR